jgi:PAS domain S-box-containing protein
MADHTPTPYHEETLPGLHAAVPGGRLERISQMAGIGYWSLSRTTGRIRWSPEMRALHGLADHEPVPTLGQWLRELVHPDDRERAGTVLSHWKLNPRQSLQQSLRVLRRDGTMRELLTHSMVEVDDGREIVLGVVIDVTPMRQAEQALRSAEGRAALTASAVGLGTWEIDLPTGAVHWDEPMWLLRGLMPRPDALAEEQRLALLHPADRERVRQLNALRTPAQYEFRVIWPDGRVHWLAARSTTLHDGQGRPLRRIGVNWDVTAHREAEQALRDHEIALQESRTRQRTLARISHDLRTPLNAILGCTQLLRDDPGLDAATRQQRLAEIESAGRQLLGLVDRVLNLASPDVDLPLDVHLDPPAASPAAPLAAAPPAPTEPAPRRRQLLYIEDNSVNAMIVSELVARRGDLDVVVADTGLAGVRLAAELQPALVLLDMQLPDIDGTEVFARLKADPRTAALPVVALSANVMKADIDAALAAGMSDYWTKPLDFAHFSRQLDARFGPAPRR